MKTIDVEDLPEPVAQAVAAMVEALRQQLAKKEEKPKRVELPSWPGTVIGSLSRKDIYSDVG